MSTGVLNLRGLDAALIEAVKEAARRRGMTLRGFAVAALAAAVRGEVASVPTVPSVPSPKPAASPAEIGAQVEATTTPTAVPTASRLPGRPDHNPKTCRVYKCGACALAGHKDPHRGLD